MMFFEKMSAKITDVSDRFFVKAKRPTLNFFIFSVFMLALSRLAIFVWYTLETGTPENFLECLCSRFDNGWYSGIITDGYNDQPFAHEPMDAANWAFFPLSPVIVRLFTFGGAIDYKLVGFIVNSLILALALTVGYKYIMLDDTSASNAVGFAVFSIFGPYTFYYSCLYTESLFMLLTLLFLYFLRKESYLLMGTVGGLLSATRVTGVLMVFAVLVYLIQKHVRERRGGFKQFLADIFANHRLVIGVCLVPMGLFIYMLYLWLKMGDSLAFMHIQRAWGRSAVNVFGMALKTVYTVDYDDFHYLMVFIFVITVAIYQLRRRTYEALPYIFPCAVNAISLGLVNMGRYSIGTGICVIGFVRMIKEHFSPAARFVLYVFLAMISLILWYGWFMGYELTIG